MPEIVMTFPLVERAETIQSCDIHQETVGFNTGKHLVY